MMAGPEMLEEFKAGDTVFAIRHNRFCLATVIKTTETKARIRYMGESKEAWRKKSLIARVLEE
jgi:hypothetical protein